MVLVVLFVSALEGGLVIVPDDFIWEMRILPLRILVMALALKFMDLWIVRPWRVFPVPEATSGKAPSPGKSKKRGAQVRRLCAAAITDLCMDAVAPRERKSFF
jgi:hypothetical protein